MSTTCLNTLIGLSPRSFECFTDEEPEGFDSSDSGFFIVDPDFGVDVIEACEIQGWTILERSRTSAIRDLKNDLAAAIRNYYEASLNGWKGYVGQLKSSGVSTPSGDFIGHAYSPVKFKGLKFVITEVHVGLNVADDYTLKVTSNDPTFVAPADVTVTANGSSFTKNELATPIELPFWSDACADDLMYLIGYDRNGAQPLYNVFSCCGSKPAYLQYMETEGFTTADMTEVDDVSIVAGAQGLVVKGYLSCEELGWLCELSEMGGYQVLSVLARALQFRAASLAIAEMIGTQAVNLCSLYNLEQLQTKRNWLNTRYSETIEWLAQNIPIGATDCFTCKQEDVFNRVELLV